MESHGDQAPKVGIHADNAPEEGPPLDDVCPICFGEFTVPCKSACGHWYCASCILEFWNHSSKPNPCKCPMCCGEILKLIPQASLLNQNDHEITKTLRDVERYNVLFSGGARSTIQKVSVYISRYFQRRWEPDRIYFGEVRLFATLLGLLYMSTPLNFIPPGANIMRICDDIAIFLYIVLHIVSYIRRRRMEQRVREMGNLQIDRD